MATYYTIDPAQFSNGEWEELAAVTSLVPGRYEFRRNAQPFKRQKFQVQLAIQHCMNKMESVIQGDLGGEDFPGQNASWLGDLSGVIIQLSRASGDLVVCRKCGDTQAYALAEFDVGTGPEKGKIFEYCSQYCLETH